MKKLLLSLSLVALAAGCQKSADKSSEPVPEQVKKLVAAAPSADQLKQVDAARQQGAAILTAEKLEAYLVYERAMLPYTKTAMGMAMSGFKKAGKDMAQAMSKDERRQIMKEANEKALAKSGLSQSDLGRLTGLASEYYVNRVMALDSEKKIAELQQRIDAATAKGQKPGAMDTITLGVTKEQLEKFEASRETFIEKRGKETAALLEKYVDQYAEIHHERMKAVLP